MSNLFELNRKVGFQKTLEILSEFENSEVNQSEFLRTCKNRGISMNSIYSAKKIMLDFELIGYRKNKNYEKIAFLTERGKKIYESILEIEEILLLKKINP